MYTKYFSFFKVFLTTPVIFLTAISCSKPEDVEPCTINEGTLSGTYKVTAAKVTFPGSPGIAEIDLFATLDPCQKDDLFILRPGGVAIVEDAGVFCDTPPVNEFGSWMLSGNRISGDVGIEGIIESFNCNKLVVYLEDYFTTGDKVTITYYKQ